MNSKNFIRRHQLFWVLIILLLLPCLVLMGIASYFLFIDRNLSKNQRLVLDKADFIFQSKAKEFAQEIQFLALDSNLNKDLRSWNQFSNNSGASKRLKAKLNKDLGYLLQNQKQNRLKGIPPIHILILTDRYGKVLAHTFDEQVKKFPILESQYKGEIQSSLLIRAASGETITTIDFVLHNANNKGGLVLHSYIPIYDYPNIPAILIGGYTLQQDTMIVDEIKNMINQDLDTDSLADVWLVSLGNVPKDSQWHLPNDNEGSFNFKEDNKNFLMLYREIRNLESGRLGYLLVQLEDNSFTSVLNWWLNILIYILPFSLLFTGLVYWFIHETIVVPKRRLSLMMCKVAEGHLELSENYPIVKSGDELSSLTYNFFKMVEKAQMIIQQEQLQREDLLKINEDSSAISSKLDKELILHLIMEKALSFASANNCEIFLVDDYSNVLESSISGGIGSIPISSELLNEGERVAHQVRIDGKTSIINSFNWEPSGEQNLISLPLIAHNKTIGIMNLYNKKGSFITKDQEMLSTLIDQAAISLDNAKLYREVADRERLRKELEIARDIQKKILPKKLPNVSNLTLGVRIKRAKDVRGNFYDFLYTPQHNLAFVLGNASERGVKAGITTLMAKTALHSIVENQLINTIDVLSQINTVIGSYLRGKEDYIKIVYGVFEGNILHYTTAGHESILLYRASLDEMIIPPSTSIALGMVDKLSGVLEEYKLELEVGDVIIFYTEGLLKNMLTENSEEYNLKELIRFVKRKISHTSQELAELIMQQYLPSGAIELVDDITVLVIKVK